MKPRVLLHTTCARKGCAPKHLNAVHLWQAERLYLSASPKSDPLNDDVFRLTQNSEWEAADTSAAMRDTLNFGAVARNCGNTADEMTLRIG